MLAGGTSRRMGRDKAILPVPQQISAASSPEGERAGGATTMVEHVVGVVSQRCQPVFVIAAPGQRLPAVEATVVRDEVRGVGPLSATAHGLRAAAQAGAERAFVCAVDMPFVAEDFIDQLAALAAQVDADVVLPWDGRDHYLAGVYRTALAEQIGALVASGERAMRALVNTVDTQRIVLPDCSSLANVNTVADLGTLAAAAGR